MPPAGLNAVFAILDTEFGLDAQARLPGTGRAVNSRMRALGIDTAQAYAKLLARDPAELGRLVDRASNKLTRFFRNRAQLSALTSIILPSLRRSPAAKPGTGPERPPIDIWVPGCSTGEEVWSLLMVLAERDMEDLSNETRARGNPGKSSIPVRITASDISKRALATAADAVYPQSVLVAIPQEHRQWLRHNGDETVVVESSIRAGVRFCHHSITSRPPGQFPVVICRNVITYLSKDGLTRAMSRLREAVEPGGYLILGNSEEPPRGTGFETIRVPGTRVFRRS